MHGLGGSSDPPRADSSLSRFFTENSSDPQNSTRSLPAADREAEVLYSRVGRLRHIDM